MTMLWEALDSLEGGTRWCKGSLRDSQGNTCFLGAISKVQGRLNGLALGEMPFFESYPAVTDPDIVAAADVIREVYPDRMLTPAQLTATDEMSGDLGVIYNFNDHNDTEFEDVSVVMQKAAIKREERVDLW